MFRKIMLPFVATLVILAGCLTTDYNLRVINDVNRYYSGTKSDSAQTLMEWNTPEWKAKNVKYWRSGGVIITNAWNVFHDNGWLGDLVADGFEGQVFVEYPEIDLIQTAFGNGVWGYTGIDVDEFYKNIYNIKIIHISDALKPYPSLIGMYSFIDGNIFPNNSTLGNFILDPALWSDTSFQTSIADIYTNSFEQAAISIGDTAGVVKFGVCLDDYTYQDWNAIDRWEGADPTAFSVDGINSWESNTPEEREAIIHPAQDAKIDMFHNAGIEVILKGDRLTTELATNISLTNKKIIGYFFDDVTLSNIDQVESDIAALRSAYIPSSSSDALLLIAGVKNDVYHSTSPTAYAGFIKRITTAGMYFTPGADDSYWNMPMTNPGDWWIRNDDDSNWQDNAPTYANAAVSPRTIIGTEIFVYDKPSAMLGAGGGGWLESGAFHPTSPNYFMLGADVVNAYYSEDGGNSFIVATDGTIDYEDNRSFYAMETIGIDNGDFSGFIQANAGGIWKFPIDGSNTWSNMTPWDDPSQLYNSEVDMSPSGTHWGFWVEAIGFCDLADSPDQRYLIASAGNTRYSMGNTIIGTDNYPNNYVTMNYSNKVGRQSLWYYWWDDPNGAKWRPLDPNFDSYNPEQGHYRAIDYAVAGTDSIVIMASERSGPQMYNITTKRYTDLSTYPWYDHNGNLIGHINWDRFVHEGHSTYTSGIGNDVGNSTLVVNEDIEYPSDAIGSISIEGDMYEFSSVSLPNTFNLTSALINTYTADSDTSNALMPISTTESIYLTDRMTGYIAVVNDYSASNIKSGVYRMQNVLFPTSWEWIGDQTLMPWVFWSNDTPRTFDAFSSGQGLAQRAVWNYISVAEGSGSEPDTLYAADRGWNAGLAKTYVPYGFGPGYDQQQTWEAKLWLYANAYNLQVMPEESFPVNEYNDATAWSGITFEPAVNPKNSNEVIIQFAGPLLKTMDGGDTWVSLEPRKYKPNLIYNSTGGYDEMCTNDLAVTSDGLLVVSNGDNGIFVSIDDTNWDKQQSLSTITTDYSPYNPETCDSDLSGLDASMRHYHRDDLADALRPDLANNVNETSGVISIPNFDGSGRDAVIWSNSKSIGETGMGTLSMWWDSDGDGIRENSAINTEAVSPTRWKFAHFYEITYKTFIGSDDITVFAPYVEATTSACIHDWVSYGVHAYHWDSTLNTWSMSTLNNFNDYQWNDATYTTSGYGMTNDWFRIYSIVWSKAENKLYIAIAIKNSVYGRVMELDLDDVEPITETSENTLWVPIAGYNSGHFTSDIRNPRKLAISEDGETLYIVNSGSQAGNGGIWKVTNLGNDVLDDANHDHPNWTSPTVEWVINNPTKITAWSIMPPSRYGETLTDRGRLSDGDTAQRDYLGGGVLINPFNSDQFWFTSVTRNKQNESNGLWAYDTITNKLKHVLTPEMDGMITYSDENILLDTYHSPWRMVIGTDCTGVYYVNWDGVFQTNKENVTDPLPVKYTNEEYPPSGVYAVNGDNEVTIYWNATPNYVNNNATGYNISRGEIQGGPYTEIAGPLTWEYSEGNPGDGQTVSAEVVHPNYIDQTAVNGTTYYYVVSTEYNEIDSLNYSEEIEATPRQNYMERTVSTEDFFGYNGSEAWTIGANLDTVSTSGPFDGDRPAELQGAQGFVASTTATGYEQAITPGSWFTIPNQNFILISCYVKSSNLNNPLSQVRLVDRTNSEVYMIQWSWTSDITKITLTSTVGTSNDGQGSYYVGDGWHRVWFIIDLETRVITNVEYSLQFMPYGSNNIEGYGIYAWGLMTEFSSTRPTELCEYIPVRPMTKRLQQLPRYWGTEDCITLEPTTPPIPANFTVDDYGDTQIDLSWDTVGEAEYYNIKRGQSTGTQTQFTTSETNSLTDIVALNYESYYYTVSSVNIDNVEGLESTEVKSYANEWLHSGEQSGDCVEGRDINLVTPNFGDGATVGVDSGSIDFAFIYDSSTKLNHIIQITGEALYWQGDTTAQDRTWFEHYTSSTLEPDSWTRNPNINLYDSSYAITNVWAPNIFKYDNIWYMCYTAVDNSQPRAGIDAVQRIMMSTSTDLINWTDGVLLLGRGYADGGTGTPEDNYKSGVPTFAEWGDGGVYSNGMRDAQIIRNESDNGWLLFVSVFGIDTVVGTGQAGEDGLIIGLAESLDINYENDPKLSILGEYELYDWVYNTTIGGDAESPQVWEENGTYFLHTSTNGGTGSQGGRLNTTTTPSIGDRLGAGSWSTNDMVSMDYKAPEMLKLNTGEYIMAYLKNGWVGNAAPTNYWEYYHINFKRMFVWDDNSVTFSNIMTTPCYGGIDLFYDNGPVPNK